jgi:hypothetical protein
MALQANTNKPNRYQSTLPKRKLAAEKFRLALAISKSKPSKNHKTINETARTIAIRLAVYR